jgi:hypothetical protein
MKKRDNQHNDSVVMLSVVMLNVVMLIVVAPCGASNGVQEQYSQRNVLCNL